MIKQHGGAMYLLKNCVWELTLACCFSCKYCGSSGGVPRENELTTEECLQVSEALSKMGCERVSLIGGEVFMRKDWDQITESLIKHGISTSIITNGYCLSKETIRRIKELQLESVAISLDGPACIHDKYRNKGSFDRAIQTLLNLSGNWIPVSVITTLNSENIDYLEELYRILLKYPISAWQLQACSPMGNAKSNTVSYAFDHKIVLDFVGNHIFEAPFTLGIADNIGYYTEKEGYLRGNLNGLGFFRGCQAGISSIGIDSIGNVRGCESMYCNKFIEGNLRTQSLEEIWNNPNAFSYNRHFTVSRLTGKCRNCSYGSICAGGCRSYNYFTLGKMYESMFCVKSNNTNA